MFHNRRDRVDVTAQRCRAHGFAVGKARCGACGEVYCAECLVYPFGPRRPPYCVRCALVAAGVRCRR